MSTTVVKSDRAIAALYQGIWYATHAAAARNANAAPADYAQRRYRFWVAWEAAWNVDIPADQIDRVLTRLDLGWTEDGVPVAVWRGE